jgi:hypothetical protein
MSAVTFKNATTAQLATLPFQGEGVVLNVTDASGGHQLAMWNGSQYSSSVSGGGNFDATDSGTNWASAPAALAIQAVLTAGTTTTVLLEVMDKAATVTTAATITADTISQVLNITVALVGAAQYRLRRSTGTGTVNLLVQR